MISDSSHEATNAYLPSFGDRGGYPKLERETFLHGHSTPQMAGRAAREVTLTPTPNPHP